MVVGEYGGVDFVWVVVDDYGDVGFVGGFEFCGDFGCFEFCGGGDVYGVILFIERVWVLGRFSVMFMDWMVVLVVFLMRLLMVVSIVMWFVVLLIVRLISVVFVLIMLVVWGKCFFGSMCMKVLLV